MTACRAVTLGVLKRFDAPRQIRYRLGPRRTARRLASGAAGCVSHFGLQSATRPVRNAGVLEKIAAAQRARQLSRRRFRYEFWLQPGMAASKTGRLTSEFVRTVVNLLGSGQNDGGHAAHISG